MTGIGKSATRKSPLKKAASKVGAAAAKGAAKAKAKVTPRAKAKSGSNIGKSYGEAKKAFSALWTDVAKESHQKFTALGDKIEQRYEQAREQISEGDLQDALKKGRDVAGKLLKSSAGWVKQLGAQVKLLYELLRDSVGGKFKVPWATMAAVAAALLYVALPVDILPDFIPGVGYIDDALVIGMCVSLTRIDLRRYAKFRELDLADFGL